MGSGRPTRSECERYKLRVDMVSNVDLWYTESDFQRMARFRGLREHVKHPDCGWHCTNCTQIFSLTAAFK